jgi:diguanylate cyclase (GGDEF)-like protein/PAS domain S-box-containing protein
MKMNSFSDFPGLMVSVIENISEGIVITDASRNILVVNRGFTEVTGYTQAEIAGKDPRILQSGRQDHAFYQAMWNKIHETGRWCGEIWNRRKNGELYLEWLTILEIKHHGEEASHYIGIFADITQARKTERDLSFVTHYDTLTALPNRLLFTAKLIHAISHAKRRRGIFALMLVDLEYMQDVNNTMGHMIGDAILQIVAQRISFHVQQQNAVARLTGDEFAVLLEDIIMPEQAAALADNILESIKKPFHIKDEEIFIGARIGICLFPQDGMGEAMLLKNAATALAEAKKHGHNHYVFYSKELTHATEDRIRLCKDLRTAVELGELFLHYQPQFCLETNAIIGVEALVRWLHPQKGVIAPADFIPLAEITGIIEKIGEWVLRTACTRARSWEKAGNHLKMAVNLSAYQIHPDLTDKISKILADTELSPGLLELEVTESLLMKEPKLARKILTELQAQGIHVAIDDFGTGYSSLAYLKHLPLSILKIDRAFIAGLPHDSRDVAICRSIIAMAHALNLKVVAEGVETETQAAFLAEQGCEFVQGYLYGRPVTADQIKLS